MNWIVYVDGAYTGVAHGEVGEVKQHVANTIGPAIHTSRIDLRQAATTHVFFERRVFNHIKGEFEDAYCRAAHSKEVG